MADNPEDELLQIFLEEATDLLGALSATLSIWQNDLNNFDKVADLKRDLHTLKGSARMVGQTTIGTLAHELETLCEALVKKQIPIDRNIFELMLSAQDRISLMIEALKNKQPPLDTEDLLNAFHKYLGTSETSKPTPAAPVTPETKTLAEEKKPEAQTQEIIRIRADLLEKINNLSTEGNLIRISLEQQINRMSTYLQEMKQGSRRLEDQLAVLNDEIENLEVKNKAEYPALEQLGNSLREITVDIFSVLKTLIEENGSMEALYLHQARVSTELQHRLSHTRLVPFDSIVPRLSRIARQIAKELKKEVDFKVLKSQGEMDRTVLEHLVPSLEHILRNALDHGIEAPDVRKKRGKPEVGNIEVNFTQSGSTVAITIADDGGGIDSHIIRKKAIKLGMLAPNAKISDEEAIRFILEPGFSTREAVSEISGRGVGMDVVNMAIKEMGGSLQIESTVGKGSKMTLRFPFTISLNRILLFTVQNEIFGILLANIESIASIPIEKINETVYEEKDKVYNQIYMGEILNKENSNANLKLTKKKTYPLLLFSGANYPLAFLVDSILYNRELVVQSLGGQFKMTDLLSGATLLGDGTVVYILDPFALSAKAKTCLEQEGTVLQTTVKKDTQSEKRKNALILIVDDSVSSRAVTQRFLERHHFQAITAKDGLDALQQLENQNPDLILLDIDMPRMDGFEFTLALKKDKNLKNIPIIVITSRITEHKKRATELKLPYLVEKPYQEHELLTIIHKILGT